MYYDAEDGPLFWEEETWEDVQSLAAQVMSGNKAVPKHSARASASTDDIPIPHDCSPEEVGDIANQLRDVIKVIIQSYVFSLYKLLFSYLKTIQRVDLSSNAGQ